MNIAEITSIKMNDKGVVFYAGVLEDGQDFRSSVRPAQNLSGLPQEVADFCSANWTEQHINSFMEASQ